jgi:hypothetical protein
MRGKPKVNQPVIIKHAKDPVVMHIEEISKDGDKCKCVWQDRVGAPYRAEFNTEVLEAYKEARNKYNDSE